jgi:glutamate synthase domain-containing protein 3
LSNIANISDTAANAEANALAPLMNSGTIVILSGAQPANANTALAGNTVLATLTFSATAFGGAVAGVITANAITSGVAANTGTATFARIYESNGSTVVMDITVGTSGSGLNLATTSIVAGATVSCSSFAYTVTET